MVIFSRSTMADMRHQWASGRNHREQFVACSPIYYFLYTFQLLLRSFVNPLSWDEASLWGRGVTCSTTATRKKDETSRIEVSGIPKRIILKYNCIPATAQPETAAASIRRNMYGCSPSGDWPKGFTTQERAVKVASAGWGGEWAAETFFLYFEKWGILWH